MPARSSTASIKGSSSKKLKKDEPEASTSICDPDFEAGLSYWNSVEASNNGVLGGFGNGTLPRIDAMSSRMFILNLMPRLSSVESSLKPLGLDKEGVKRERTRALDVGAGIGRVTSTVLLPLVSTVEVLEPAPHFLQKGIDSAASAEWKQLKAGYPIPDFEQGGKAVRFYLGGLSGFDPAFPTKTAIEKARHGDVTSAFQESGGALTYDLIMCQWCLGHLSDPDLVKFFQAAKQALKPFPTTEGQQFAPKSYLIVKENCCPEAPDAGESGSVQFDDEDSSLTRSDLRWKWIFREAGLKLVREELQLGFPKELFAVMTYALV